MRHTRAASGSHVEALVLGLARLPLSEEQVDVGGYKIIHLVALYFEKKTQR